MKRYVNLMSESARFRATAWLNLRRWALGLALLMAILVPLSGMHWREYSRMRREHEALEARYEPIKRLNALNVKLRNEAAALVRDERMPLELSQSRATAVLLGLASAAAATTHGELFIEHLNVTQNAPRGENEPAVPERMVIEVAATLTYDVAGFVQALHQAPIEEVKVISDEVVAVDGVDRKNYTIECAL